jgi:hypothetical protein
MERQFNNGDFEKLLRDNANQYRMYPSEKVWKGIDSALHSRRRGYGLTALIMFLITGSVVSYFIFTNKPGQNNLTEQKNTSVQNNSSTKNSAPVSGVINNYTPAVTRPISNVTVPSTDVNKPYLIPLETVPAIAEGSETSPDPKLNNTLVIDETGMSNEMTNGYTEQLPFGLILVDNTKTPLDESDIKYAVIEKSITDQNLLRDDTEKRINELVSALASQNVTLVKPKKQARVTAQVYFTPTVSYRKLVENKKVYAGSGYLYVPAIDLNNVVKHKPAMGLEFGIEGRYRVSEKFSLKTGFQFNINRYDIRAYSHPTEIATVALSSGFGFDSLATLSNYRNYSGNNSPNWLENFYFQAAVPVGAELILSDNNDLQWGVSATIQPTYVIGDRAYLISSDYKNYAKFPDLMRRWNISTGIGTFVSYSTGRIKWQVGPHARYQHLSSFVKELTVKEKLFSVGLKVGATLNNNKK